MTASLTAFFVLFFIQTAENSTSLWLMCITRSLLAHAQIRLLSLLSFARPASSRLPAYLVNMILYQRSLRLMKFNWGLHFVEKRFNPTDVILRRSNKLAAFFFLLQWTCGMSVIIKKFYNITLQQKRFWILGNWKVYWNWCSWHLRMVHTTMRI